MLQVVRGSFPAKLLLAALLIMAVPTGYAATTAAQTEADVREEAQTELVTDTRQASAATTLWLDGVESQARSAADAVTATSDPASGLERFAASHETPPGVVGYGYAEDGEYVAGTVDGIVGERGRRSVDRPGHRDVLGRVVRPPCHRPARVDRRRQDRGGTRPARVRRERRPKTREPRDRGRKPRDRRPPRP